MRHSAACRVRRAPPRKGPTIAIVAVIAAVGLLVTSRVHAQGCVARSGPHTAPLVELYTSEGCDSCPPADRWLSSAVPADGSAAVALAFHVDYWDRLGWKDRFAQPAHTQRQYDAMRANRATFVYTPQVLVQGRDFPAWRSGASASTLAALAARPARAEIALEAASAAGAIVVQSSARVLARDDAVRAALVIALVDSGLVSEVKAGENAGKRLVHDHVVRHIAPAIPVGADGIASGRVTLSQPEEGGTRRGVVAFVQDLGSGNVLQALALALPAPGCAPPR